MVVDRDGQAAEPEPESPQPQGISLSELTEAFAQAMGVDPKAPGQPPTTSQGSPPAEPADTADEPAADLSDEHEPAPGGEEDDRCEISPRSIFEAMLFVGDRESQPLSGARAAEWMRGVEADEIPQLVGALNSRYAENNCPYHIIHEGGGYRLTLRKPFHGLRNRFYGRVREARLSQAAVDVLAIVAYQQPLTTDQITRLRGKPCGHVLLQLVRRGLLRIERQQEGGKRRTARYRTTARFLGLFGLETLEDLPQSEELQRQ
ncbi:MAG: SMC-Scp complex subunit ScpB [Pirellulales bacterium]|nr:SMC-Scp complex subunit ScpB [Pirellulales bacterium]